MSVGQVFFDWKTFGPKKCFEIQEMLIEVLVIDETFRQSYKTFLFGQK